MPGTGNLMAVSFDVERLEVSGSSVPILEGVRHQPVGAADYTFSDDGTLVYIPGGEGFSKGAPVWVGRDGEVVERIVDEPLVAPHNPRVSPDGRRLALTVGTMGNHEIWIHDLSGRPPYPIAFGPSIPVWSPDSRRVVFSGGNMEAGAIIAWAPADGSTLEAEPLVTLSQPLSLAPLSWSPDGRELLYLQVSPESTGNIMALQIEGEWEPRLVVHTEVRISRTAQRGGLAAFSPDGRWLAYVSAVTGAPEIWVQAYPDPGAPIRVSPNGGLEPVWGPEEGRELFYLEDDKMMAVRVETEPEFRFQPPEVLFEGGYSLGPRPSYDVGPDGRFLMIKEEEGSAQINVILNWFEELKRLVPTDN
jgi:Tol biopolymer transport system component